MPLPQRIAEKRSLDPVSLLFSIMNHLAQDETDSFVLEDSIELLENCLLLHRKLSVVLTKLYRTAELRRQAEREFMGNVLNFQEVKRRY